MEENATGLSDGGNTSDGRGGAVARSSVEWNFKMKTCATVRRENEMKDGPICCESCHEDDEDYGIEMMTVGDYYVCCKVAHYLRNRKAEE
jgi:hypothetical protein